MELPESVSSSVERVHHWFRMWRQSLSNFIAVNTFPLRREEPGKMKGRAENFCLAFVKLSLYCLESIWTISVETIDSVVEDITSDVHCE